MELNKENQHIVMQWNDSILLPITAFLVCFRKKLFQRMVAINIHDRRPVKQLALMFCFSGCHIAKVDY
jgi:hypothetical protein